MQKFIVFRPRKVVTEAVLGHSSSTQISLLQSYMCVTGRIKFQGGGATGSQGKGVKYPLCPPPPKRNPACVQGMHNNAYSTYFTPSQTEQRFSTSSDLEINSNLQCLKHV